MPHKLGLKGKLGEAKRLLEHLHEGARHEPKYMRYHREAELMKLLRPHLDTILTLAALELEREEQEVDVTPSVG